MKAFYKKNHFYGKQFAYRMSRKSSFYSIEMIQLMLITDSTL